MKRFAFLVAALAMFAVAAPAYSEAVPKSFDINWRQARAANPNGGFADSAYMATATGTVHADTSTTIDLSQFVLPGKGAGNLVVVGDSLSWLKFEVFPATSSPTIAADSILVEIQVRMGGESGWQTTTPTVAFNATATNPPGARTANAAYVLEQGSTNSFFYVIRQRLGAVASGDIMFPILSSSTAPTIQQLYGWKEARIIVSHGVNNTGRFDARVTGFVPAGD